MCTAGTVVHIEYENARQERKLRVMIWFFAFAK